MSAGALLRGRNFGEHYKASAAILDSAFFAVLEAGGRFLAVTDGHEPLRRNALIDKKIPRGLGPLRAKREIVFRRADIVAMTFDLDPRFRVGFHPFGIFFKNFLRFWFEFDAIKWVIDIFEGRPWRSHRSDTATDCLHRGRGMHAVEAT